MWPDRELDFKSSGLAQVVDSLLPQQSMTTVAVNPYLDDNFAPVQTEITAQDLKVLGEIPADLAGMFVRNGPNPQFPPLGHYHWFDGDGMLHGVQIGDGKASYRNRYIRTQGFNLERDAGRALWSGLLEPPQPDSSYGAIKNTANTALVWHGGQLLALWEAGEPHAIQVPSLNTIGPYTYRGKLASAFTAHPKVDPVTGEMMFFGYSLATAPFLQYSVVSAQGELFRTVPIDLPMGVMMHDFAVTEHYTIFMDLPLTFSLERMQRGEPALLFERDRPSRFGILPRHGDNSNIRWFEAPACYVFHTLNAYETPEEVVLIACRMKATTILGTSTPSDPESDIPRLHRWRFNLHTGAVMETALDDIPSEFPRVNEQYLGYETRYGYTARAASGPIPRFDGLLKYDFVTDHCQSHQFGAERYGGEAVFVPQPNATAEDDGWLLTFVYDQGEETSELVVLSAQDLTTPIARIIMPQRVPYGFHGTWIAQTQLAES
jgi:carotenoid cleavage dioxygenase